MPSIYYSTIKKSKLTTLIVSLLFLLPFCLEAQQNIQAQLAAADLIKSSNPKKFTALIQKLEQRIPEFSSEQIDFYHYLQGYHAAYNGNLTKAVNLYEQVINSSTSPLLKFRANLSVTNIYANYQDWDKSLVHLNINFDLLKNVKDSNYYHQGLILAATVYNQLEQFELGYQYSQHTELQEVNGRNKCLSNHLSIESLLHLNRMSTDDEFISNAIVSCESEPIMANFIRTNLAKLYIEQTLPQNALSTLIPHLDAIDNTQYPRLIVEVYSVLAQAYFDLQKFDLANQYTVQAIELGAGNITKALVNALRIRYQIAKLEDQNNQALSHHEEYVEADRAYFNLVKAKHLAFQLAQHQTIQKENEIELLNEQNQLLKLQQQLIAAERENDRLFMLLSLLVIFVLVFFGFRLWRTQKRLKQLAEYDALTGLFNRGHFVEVAKSTLRYCQQTKQHASIIMFDLDKFKSINDNFGHAAGDWALQASAKVCLSLKREQDIVARIGGEEFCIILPSCGVFKTEQIAEKYRQALARLDTQTCGSVFAVSASFGITDTVTSGYNLERLLADADEAMYQSKRNGRDQVTIFAKTDS